MTDLPPEHPGDDLPGAPLEDNPRVRVRAETAAA